MHAVIIITLGSKPIGTEGVGFGTTERWIQLVIGWGNDWGRIKGREAELGSAQSCSKRKCDRARVRDSGQATSRASVCYMSLPSLWGGTSRRRRDGTKYISCTSHRSSSQEDTHLLMLLGCTSGAFYPPFNPVQLPNNNRTNS